MRGVVSGSPMSPVHTKRMDHFLLLLLLASLSLNVYLGWKVRQAKTTSSIQQNTFSLSPGMKVNPVIVVSLDGKEHTFSFTSNDKPTVFYVLSPSCVWCERNKANIKKLAELRGGDFRFVGISLADPGLKEYMEGHHLNFPVYTRLTSETINSLGLGSTPQTIVISSDGRVLKNWTGAYTERLQPEVEAYFGISLPGLSSGSN